MTLALSITVAVLLVACVWLGVEVLRQKSRANLYYENAISSHDRWKQMCHERRIEALSLKDANKTIAAQQATIAGYQKMEAEINDAIDRRMMKRTDA